MIDLNGLISHCSHARLQQRLSKRFARRQMKIREEDLSLAQQWKLRLKRLFHFHDHVSPRENFFRLIDNLSASFDVLIIRITRANAGVPLYNDRMTAPGKLSRSRWQQGDALLLLFNFFPNTNDHVKSEK